MPALRHYAVSALTYDARHTTTRYATRRSTIRGLLLSKALERSPADGFELGAIIRGVLAPLLGCF